MRIEHTDMVAADLRRILAAVTMVLVLGNILVTTDSSVPNYFENCFEDYFDRPFCRPFTLFMGKQFE